MNLKAKITLSDKERSILMDRDWILHKQSIIQKVYELFSVASMTINSLFEINNLNKNLTINDPKIYRGENYNQFPYVMLDYPRIFGKKDVFAIRTMFWWGNFFSITLHLSGEYKSLINIQQLTNQNKLQNQLHICVNENQWEHHFNEDNYDLLKNISKEELLRHFNEKDFIKIAIKFDLENWDFIPDLLEGGYKLMAELLINFPNDGKDL
jgi:hypothetical protein